MSRQDCSRHSHPCFQTVMGFIFLWAIICFGIATVFAAELEDRFIQMRQAEVEAKEARVDDVKLKIQAMQEQLHQERQNVRESQERIWQEFASSTERERKDLNQQMETLQERQRLFEKELEKKKMQDDVRLKEREAEIQRLMLDLGRLEAEILEDRKDYQMQLKELEGRKELRQQHSPVQEARGSGSLEGATIRVVGARGREIIGEEPLQAHDLRPEYYIDIGDVLEIDVWRVPDLTRAITVRPDGRISMPLAGDVDVLGLTLVELRNLLTERLGQYIRDPQVSISIRQFGGRKFIILGEIKSPGVYRFQNDVTLIEGIALAGGLNKAARRGKIAIIRGDIRKEPQVRIISANLESVLKRGIIGENLRILPNDIIYVGRDFLGDSNDLIDNLIQPALESVIDFFVLRSAIRTAQQRDA
ncbi:MAG: polysaccharide biosynthesis/export family protein [Candidatus Omnitrophica bacterium]|nr:polysaccharide biosynthesis/export family protein [Candidatus Omnitrophota bacterium]